MPPKRSQRLRNPSAQAVEIAASSAPQRRKRVASQPAVDTQRKKSRRGTLAQTPENRSPPASVETDQSASSSGAAAGGPQPLSLPQGVLDQLVARVADEVTRRLSPPEDSGSSNSNALVTNAASELPIVSTPLSPAGAIPVPGVAVAASTLAGTILQSSVGTTQASLSGEVQIPAQLFTSPSLPIDARVSEKIRSKIWNNEFFDFADLLSNPVFEDRYQLTLSNSSTQKFPALWVEPLSRAKKHMSIETWLSCLHIFVGVYTSRFPHEAPALMKYGEVVQDLAARGGNWKFYDENFRFLRQAQPASFPWGVTHWELWMRAQHSVKQQTNAANPGRAKPQDRGTPKGYCFKFHKGMECIPNCAYKHLCYKCQGSHPVSRCNFRGQSRVTSNKPLPAKSQPNKS